MLLALRQKLKLIINFTQNFFYILKQILKCQKMRITQIELFYRKISNKMSTYFLKQNNNKKHYFY